MLSGPLRLLSIVGSLVVVLSFAAFAVDEARSGSQASQAGIANNQFVAKQDVSGYANPTPAQEKLRDAAHGRARELLDEADDVLLSPFASVGGSSSSSWVRRGVPGLIALVVYGFGLGFLARFASGRA